MKNEIRFVEEKKGVLNVKTYEGYDYVMKIHDDGLLKTISAKPNDPVYGCQISGLEFGRPYIQPPELALADLWRLNESVAKAKGFCEEFLRRKEEF